MDWKILSMLITLGPLVTQESKAFDVMEFPARTEGVLMTSANLLDTNNKAIHYLRSKVGRAEQEYILKLAESKFPDFRIFGICGGTFKTPGNSELALALGDEDLKQVIYSAVLTNKRGEKYLYPLAEFKIPVADDNLGGRSPSIRCNSSTEILRIAQDYARISSNSAAHAELTLVSSLDAICVVPFNSVAEFMCYQYVDRKKKFKKIGEWYND